MFIGGSVFLGTIAAMIIVLRANSDPPIPVDGAPQSIRIALPSYPTVMELGSSRVLEVIFYSGYDDRNSDDYKTVTKRDV